MQQNPNRVAVIIPFFNREDCLARAIESVLRQSYKDFHLYLVDDASTDASLSIAKEFEASSSQVSLLISNTNKGVSASRNLVLSTISSEYYALLDSDDEWLSTKLEMQMNALKETRLKVCHTEELWIRNGVRVNQMKKHQKFGGWILEHCLEMCKMSPSSIVFHKDVIDKIGIFREDFPVCEDFDLWLKLARYFEVVYLDQALIKKYGGHEDQLSRKFHSMDYWRILSLNEILSTELEPEMEIKVKKQIHKKGKQLLKGYVKHNNMSNHLEISNIVSNL